MLTMQAPHYRARGYTSHTLTTTAKFSRRPAARWCPSCGCCTTKLQPFLMGLHPRLGLDSSLWMLSDVSTVIVKMMLRCHLPLFYVEPFSSVDVSCVGFLGIDTFETYPVVGASASRPQKSLTFL